MGGRQEIWPILYGKISVIKTFGITAIILCKFYSCTRLCNKGSKQNAIPIYLEFKNEKVKRTTITGYMEYGGLKVIDLQNQIKVDIKNILCQEGWSMEQVQ